MTASRTKKGRHYVVCLSNAGHPASLELRKLYVALPDPEAAKEGLVRVIDESGEDYLYPRASFRAINLPRGLARALAG